MQNKWTLRNFLLGIKWIKILCGLTCLQKQQKLISKLGKNDFKVIPPKIQVTLGRMNNSHIFKLLMSTHDKYFTPNEIDWRDNFLICCQTHRHTTDIIFKNSISHKNPIYVKSMEQPTGKKNNIHKNELILLVKYWIFFSPRINFLFNFAIHIQAQQLHKTYQVGIVNLF